MLYTQTVTPATLALLKDLMALPELRDFVLVGGTNLSLRYGHRLSLDLDLFTNRPFNSNDILPEIQRKFTSVIVGNQKMTSLQCFINDIKIDIVLHKYPYVNPIEIIDNIRLASIPDIIAMKLNAIAQRGAKKDFWDVAELLDSYTIADMLQYYQEKYFTHDIYFVVRALTYFKDAENLQHKIIPVKQISWKQVKTKIEIAVKQYLNNLR